MAKEKIKIEDDIEESVLESTEESVISLVETTEDTENAQRLALCKQIASQMQ